MANDFAKAEMLADVMNSNVGQNMPTKKPVNDETVLNATQTLKKYQDAKNILTARLKANEDWWRIRHWEWLNEYGEGNDERPRSAWLFNTVISKHAELMDAYPTFNCLPREVNDKEEAQRLSEILPVVLERNDFEEVYSNEGWQKLKSGFGVFGVFWDGKALNGLGDIKVVDVDPLSLYWQPGISNIQASKNVFYTQDIDNDALVALYPQLKGKLGGTEIRSDRYINDESRVDTTDKSMVVDWYYKKTDENGRQLLHYAQFCNGTLLFASENEPDKYPDGWYIHGQYPFVVDVLFPVKEDISGFGYVDVCRDPQKYIDLVGQAFAKNAMFGGAPRFFIREDGNVNEKEFADATKPFVHVSGNLGEDSIREIKISGIDSSYMVYLNNKIDEMKETSGNRDVANGGTTAGATAASAIAALQSASGKVGRDSTKASYRAYRKVVLMCIELVRQFYDLPRQFRIVGQDGMEQFITYTNAGLNDEPIMVGFDGQVGRRVPVFDLEISAQEENAYTKMSQNELALQFYKMGFFNPQFADQSLACLDMMDFKGKNEVMQKIQTYQTLQQQLMLWQQMAVTMAQKYNDPMVLGLMQQTGMAPQQPLPSGDASAPEVFSEGKKEGRRVEKARAQAIDAYTPQ